MDIKYNFVCPTYKKLLQLEKLRIDAYQEPPVCDERRHYLEALESGRYIAISSSFDDEFLAGCYISSSFSSLSIEQLFVAYRYQEKGYYLGKRLLMEVLRNQRKIEEIFQMEFSESRLYASTSKARRIYESLGYQGKKADVWLIKKL